MPVYDYVICPQCSAAIPAHGQHPPFAVQCACGERVVVARGNDVAATEAARWPGPVAGRTQQT